MLLAGCALAQPVSFPCTLIIKPQIVSGQLTQATVAPYDKNAIHHLSLKLYIGAQDTGFSKTLLNAQLDNPVVFSNLKAHTTYTVKAFAYASTDDTLLISTTDANSWTDITLTDDDRPTLDTLKVKLIDRSFDGQATSSIGIIPGGYSPIGTESLVVPKVLELLAGNGTAGGTDGVGSNATFFNPAGITVGANGYIYVADYAGHRIRRVSSMGVVSTIAGNGQIAFANGIGTSATFSNPRGLALDSNGNLYVADDSNHRIRKITPDGVVTTFAGNDTAGTQDGQGTSATFKAPNHVVFDSNGNLYVSDHGAHNIRKITPGGLVSTFAGSGSEGSTDATGTNASFSILHGIVFDTANNLYVADYGNNKVRKITPAGVVSTLAGNGSSGSMDGSASQATFNHPAGIAIDSKGNLYMADGGGCIRKITQLGDVTTLIGTGSINPWGLTMDKWDVLYLTDCGNHKVRTFR